MGISAVGVVVGTYDDAGCERIHGFLRAPDGTFTNIDFPGAGGTGLTAIDPGGTVTGGIGLLV